MKTIINTIQIYCKNFISLFTPTNDSNWNFNYTLFLLYDFQKWLCKIALQYYFVPAQDRETFWYTHGRIFFLVWLNISKTSTQVSKYQTALSVSRNSIYFELIIIISQNSAQTANFYVIFWNSRNFYKKKRYLIS